MSKRADTKNKQNAPLSATGLDHSYKLPVFYLIFFIAAFVVYGQNLNFYLGKFDEDTIILGKLDLLKDISNIKLAFTRDAFLSDQGSQFYRPLQTVSYMIDARFFKVQGSSFFLTNILIHAATCSALFYLLLLLHKNWKSALALALLYLGSPLFVHAVAWIPSRGDLLIGLFGILSLIFFVRMFERQKLKFGVFAAIAFLLAMFSKETAVLIPFMLLLYYLFADKSKRPPQWQMLITAGVFVFIAVSYFYLRSQVIKIPATNDEFGLASLIHNLRTLPEYFAKFFVPVHLSPMAGFTVINTVLGLILIVLLIALVLRFATKPYKTELIGLTWFIVFALPGLMYSHKFGSAAYDYLEHRSYLPMVGIIIMLSSLHNAFKDSKTQNRISASILIIGIVLGIYSHQYAQNYKNPMIFYDYTISSNPSSAMALSNRGLIKADLKDYQGAIEDYDKALMIKPDYSRVYVNKGISLAAVHNYTEAVKQYDSAIVFEPDLFAAHFNKANAETELGAYAEALREYTVAMALSPAFIPVYSSRGVVYSQLKDYVAAEKDFAKAIELDGKNAAAYVNRGKMRLNQNNAEGACADWLIAADLGDSEAAALIDTYCKK